MRKARLKIGDFFATRPYVVVGLATLAFIVVVVGASLYSNAVVWDLATGPGGQAIGRGGHPSLAHTLVQYDGFQYTHIAQNGYTNITYTAFLPLYPLIIRLVSGTLSIPVDYVALGVSWAAFCGAMMVLYTWAKLEFERHKYRTSPWAVIGLVLAFPTALYFVLPYTESLFLLLNVSALLLFRKQHYLAAGIIAALASATRFQGILLALYFFLEFLQTRRKDLEYQKLLASFLGCLGLLAYVVWLAHSSYHNPLSFIDAEKSWGRFGSNIVANLVHSMRPLYLWYIPVALVGLWSVRKYFGWTYFAYSLAFFAMPLMSGNLTSINRYLLSLAPMFLGLAILLHEKLPNRVFLLYGASSVFLLSWSILLFANGYWVA